jgi:hypothetical protein
MFVLFFPAEYTHYLPFHRSTYIEYKSLVLTATECLKPSNVFLTVYSLDVRKFVEKFMSRVCVLRPYDWGYHRNMQPTDINSC